MIDFFNVNNLIICGKANQDIPVEKLRKNKTDEVWLCGTDKRKGADLYFEIHGIKTSHKNVVEKFSKEVYNNGCGLTVSNTISGMLIYAWQHGYTDIEMLGTPMILEQYRSQRGCVEHIVNWLNENGLCVIWEDQNMAEKKNKPNEEKKAEQKTSEQKAESKATKEQKIVKVKVFENLTGEWGVFELGKSYEVSEVLAKQFVKDKLAEIEK